MLDEVEIIKKQTADIKEILIEEQFILNKKYFISLSLIIIFLGFICSINAMPTFEYISINESYEMRRNSQFQKQIRKQKAQKMRIAKENKLKELISENLSTKQEANFEAKN